MKYYITLDGKVFGATTKSELVQILMGDLRLPMHNKRQFMKKMARWCQIQKEGVSINTRNPDVFVDDLIANGFLKVMEDL